MHASDGISSFDDGEDPDHHSQSLSECFIDIPQQDKDTMT
jgi:hypothetical protein